MIGDFYFFLVTYFYLFININAYDVKETTIVFRLDSNGQLINTETYDDKNIEEVMNLKENKHIFEHRASIIFGAEWYVNVQDWNNYYISITSSLKAIGKDIYLMGTSSVDVEVTGSSGTLSEQTFMYHSPRLNKVVYAFPKDMYVGNSKQITISSVGGHVYFNTGEAFTAIHGSKTFSR